MLQLCAVSESGIEKENTRDRCQQMCANITARDSTRARKVIRPGSGTLTVKVPWEVVGSPAVTNAQ